jgi:hypothetical protein
LKNNYITLFLCGEEIGMEYYQAMKNVLGDGTLEEEDIVVGEG